MVTHGIPYVNFDFANNLWQGWHNGAMWGAWGNWYDQDDEEWDDADDWNGYNVGGPDFVAVIDIHGHTFQEQPDQWLVQQGMVNIGNDQADWQIFHGIGIHLLLQVFRRLR